MSNVQKAKRDVAIANRILAREGVVDAYGHVSVRHPVRPDRYFLSRSRSPELVTVDHIIEFDLGGATIDVNGRVPYLERFIHGATYEARPDVDDRCACGHDDPSSCGFHGKVVMKCCTDHELEDAD